MHFRSFQNCPSLRNDQLDMGLLSRGAISQHNHPPLLALTLKPDNIPKWQVEIIFTFNSTCISL